MTATPQTPLEGLIAAGLAFNGARVCESAWHPVLAEMAQEHAEYMARYGQGHQGFESRARQIFGLWPDADPREICDQSWEPAAGDTPLSIGKQMFDGWFQVRNQEGPEGHWFVASRKWDHYGAGITRGHNGTWYCCVIVANENRDATIAGP